MVLNMKDDDLPTLTLERAAQVIVSKEIVYLGDIFNEQGNNDGPNNYYYYYLKRNT